MKNISLGRDKCEEGDRLIVRIRQKDIYSHPQTDLFRSIRTHQCG